MRCTHFAVLAGLLSALFATVASGAHAQASMQQQMQQAVPDKGFDPNQNYGAELQQLGAALQQLMQQMQSYGAQQKSDPQTLAMLKLMFLQADTMRAVTAALSQQAQANANISSVEKAKKLAALQAISQAAPVVAQQKETTKKTIADMQEKLQDAATKIQTEEKAKLAKDQVPLVAVQTALLQIQARLYMIMLAELAG